MENNNQTKIVEVDATMRLAAETIISGEYQAAVVAIIEIDEDGDKRIHTYCNGRLSDKFYLSEYLRQMYKPEPFSGCED